MKKVIMPVDFSESSIKAARLAISIAKQCNIEIKLVHINTFLAEPGLNVDATMKILNEHKNEIALAMNKIKKIFKDSTNIKISSLIEMDAFVSQGVVDIAEAYKADLIIMGTDGTNTLMKKIIGSNTLSVASQTEIPILIFTPHTEIYDIQNVLYVSEVSQGRESLCIDKAKKFAKYLEANIINIIINNNVNNNSSGDTLNINKYVPTKYITSKDSIVNILNDYILNEAPYSLVAMTNYKRGIFEKLFSADVINDIVNNAKFPILLYPNK